MVFEYLQSCHSLVLFYCYSLVLFIRSFVSSLPVPFPIIFVCFDLLDLDLRLTPTLSPAYSSGTSAPAPEPRTRPSPFSRTRIWISLDIIVCRLMALDCVLSSGACHIKENPFFTPETRLAIGSYYPSITQGTNLFGGTPSGYRLELTLVDSPKPESLTKPS